MKIYKEIKNGETGEKKYVKISGREDSLQAAAMLIAHYNIADSGVDDIITPSEINRAVSDAMISEILVTMLEKNLLK